MELAKFFPRMGAIILAGGLGQRVARQNKGLLPLYGKPLVLHIIENLRQQVGFLAISANDRLNDYKQYNLPVFTDLIELTELGPLAGIASVYLNMPKNIEAILVVPCDTPFLPNNLVSCLAEALFADEHHQIAYAKTKDCIHPSVFLCKPGINQQLLAHINTGKQSLKSWIFQHNAVEVYFEDEHAFTNINYLEMLASLNQANLA